MRQRLEYQTKVRESVLPSEVLRRSIREAEPWEIERL